MKIRLILATCLVLISLSACSQTTIPTASATSTVIPTRTSTLTPSATSTMTPTPTEVLSPQEQRDLEYKVKVPEGTSCLVYKNLITSGGGEIPTSIEFANIKVYPTGNDKIIPLNWGSSGATRDVRVVEVGCRDEAGHVAELMWLPIGGNDFGSVETGKGIILIYYVENNMTGASSLTDEEILEKIKDKAITVRIPMTVPDGYTPPDNPYFEKAIYLSGREVVFSNELTIEALRKYPENKEQLDLLINNQSVIAKNFILYPLHILITDN